MSTEASVAVAVPARRAFTSIEELDAEWNRQRQILNTQLRAKLRNPNALLLACVPIWTVSLARRVARNMESAAGLEKLLVPGQLEMKMPPLEEDRTEELIRFEMPANSRTAVFQEHASDPALRAVMWETMRKVAHTLTEIEWSPADPVETLEWAKLVAPAGSASQFVDLVDGVVREAESTSEIHRALSIARAFEPALLALDAGPLDAITLRGGRRVELLHRAEVDSVHLVHFQKRGEQLDAIGSLVGNDDEHWALHLVGAGGVGKTTLLRYIGSDFANGRFAVARVDFDYLNPDYPRLAPGMLLWAFGQDLRAYGGRRFDELLKDADAILEKVHQQLRANSHATSSLIQHPDFVLAVRHYVEAMQTLNLRILLILDTCEELARMRPDGSVPENVQDTFGILKLLHDGLPRLRVILAGRRPLASSGFHWKCPEAPDFPARPYLRLHEIRGFTHQRSAAYLKAADVPAELHAPIIQRCKEIGSVMKVEWDDKAHAPKTIPRCNPYDLRLYAEWASERPAPTPERIANSNDSQYIEFRIIQRLRHQEFSRLLPIVATLGHIDDYTLRELAEGDAESFAKLQRAVRQQEWTSVRAIVESSTAEPRHVYSVEPGICQRLRAYFRPSMKEWSPLLKKACRYLVRRTLKEDLRTLDRYDFDAAFSALCAMDKPEFVARWWRTVELRLLDRGPEWTRDLLKYLQSAQSNTGKVVAKATEKEAEIARLVRPAILATYATAVARCDRFSPAAFDLWTEVVAAVDEYPLRGDRNRLGLRAKVGRLAVSRDQLCAADFEDVGSALRAMPVAQLDRPCRLAMVWAAENLLDRAELTDLATGRRVSAVDQSTCELVVQFDQAISRYCESHGQSSETAELGIWMRCLRGRAYAQVEQTGPAKDAFADARARSMQALDTASKENSDRFRQLAIRVHLEYARIAYPLWSPPKQLFDEISDFAQREVMQKMNEKNPVHVDRLAAVVVRVWTSCSALDGKLVDILKKGLHSEPLAGATAAERCVPPLCCVAAEDLAEYGFVDLAVERLVSMLLDTSKYEEEVRRELERSYVRICMRYRLFEAGHGSVESLLHSERPSDIEMLRVAGAMQRSAQSQYMLEPAGAEHPHAVWRSVTFSCSISDDERKNLHRWLQALKEQDGLVARLDQIECALLLDAKTSPNQCLSDDGRAEIEGIRRLLRSSLDPALDAELLLRAHALSVLELKHDDIEQITLRLGARRAAELAFDETTILSLRLPTQAKRLASQAAYWFKDAGDLAGEIYARTAKSLLAGPSGEKNPVRDEELPALWPILDSRLHVDPRNNTESPPSPLWRPWHDRFILVGDADTPTKAEARDRLASCPLPELRKWVAEEPAEAPQSPSTSPWVLVIRWLAVIGVAASTVGGYIYFKYYKDSSREFESLSLKDDFWIGLITLTIISLSSWAWRQWFLPRWLRLTCKCLTGLFCTYALFILMVYLVIFVSADLLIPFNSESVILALCWLTAVAYGFWRLFRYVRVFQASKKAIWLQIHEIDTASTTTQPGIAQSGLSLILQPIANIFVPRKWRTGKGSVECKAGSINPGEAYAAFAREFDPPLAPVFRRMRRYLGMRRGSFAFDTSTAEEHAWPAEAVAFISAGSQANFWSRFSPRFWRRPRADRLALKSKSTLSIPFRMRRAVIASTPFRPPLPISSRKERIATADTEVEITAQGSLHEELPKIWRAGTSAQRLPTATATDHSARILHLVGSAHHDTGGLRFQVRKTDPGDVGGSIETEPPVVLRAEDVASKYPHLALCVIQGQTRSSLNRADSDRRRAGLARVFAARLSQCGVPRVIVVPPLPPDLAKKAAEDIARYTAANTLHDDTALLAMLDQLRHQISSELSRPIDLREVDIVDPEAVAKYLLSDRGRAGPLYKELSPAVRNSLKRWAELPREALVGLLMDGINPVLRRTDLVSLYYPQTSLRRLARWLGIGGIRMASNNRRILSLILGRRITNGKDDARRDAWEVALDCCAFFSDNITPRKPH